MDGQNSPQDAQEPQQSVTPGSTITPTPSGSAVPTGNNQSPVPSPSPEPPAEEPIGPATPTAEVQNPSVVTTLASTSTDGTAISWTASEYIAHHKSAGWYLVLALAALVLAAAAWLVTKDKISSLVIIIAAVMLGGYGARQPQQLSYRLDSSGITIGKRYYPYSAFRSFSIVPEGAFSSLVFLPLKRFSPLLTVYYDPQDEDDIVAILSDRLPMEDRKQDPVDRLMRRIRF